MRHNKLKYRVFTGCIELIKSIHLRLKSTLAKMYKNKRFKHLQDIQNKTFDAFEKFIAYYNSEVDEGDYLGFIEKLDNAITIRVGAEKFTVHSQINLHKSDVSFIIFDWVFDMSKPERYSHTQIHDLDFIYDGDCHIMFVKPRTMITDIGDKREYLVIINFNVLDTVKYLRPFF